MTVCVRVNVSVLWGGISITVGIMCLGQHECLTGISLLSYPSIIVIPEERGEDASLLSVGINRVEPRVLPPVEHYDEI